MNTRRRLHTLARIVLGTALLGLLYGCEFSRTVNPVPPQNPVDTSTHGGSGIVLSLAPPSTSVPIGGTRQFQATITGTANTGVLWSVASGPGTISADGLYSAPATITGDSLTAAIRASSAADTSASATATVMVFRPSTGGNGGGGNGGCDTTNVTFAGTIKPILQNNCVGCHSGPAAPNGVNLTGYAGAKAVATSGKLAGVIQHSPGFPSMPKGGAKLPDCKVAQILAWINRGAPNN